MLRSEERDAEIRLAEKQAELDRAETEVKDAFAELKVLASRLSARSRFSATVWSRSTRAARPT